MHHESGIHILLIEDTAALLEMYALALEQKGYRVTQCQNGQGALDALKADTPFDMILLDLKLPDMEGIEILRRIRGRNHKMPVIVITGHGSINTAIEAMREGACDFLVKPFDIERLYGAIESELDKQPLDTMPEALAGYCGDDLPHTPNAAPQQPANPAAFGGFIGTSPIMQKVYEQIENAARSTATVFITGESGTGKEVCAEAIHKYSVRAGKPFVPINCAAIPRDLMESELFGHVKGAFTGAIADRDGAARQANGGTLFLDEIAEMNPDMQTKLLRFLQTLSFQKVGSNKPEQTDIRIICATNRNPSHEIKAGRFREDLFYRLHVLPLYMPPLRERGEDVIDIAQTLLRRYAAEERKDFDSFGNDALEVMCRYGWPGNIRELQNTLRNIVVMHDGPVLTASMLPATVRNSNTASPPRHTETPAPSSPSQIRPLADIERETIEQAIALCRGNIPKAAAALGVSPSTLYRKKASWEEEKQAV